MNYKWKPIDDIILDWAKLESQDLRSLRQIWIEHQAKLKNTVSLKQFNERLSREWSIETGIIENLYSLDRGVTRLLVEKGIHESLIPHDSSNKSPSQIVAILKDHEEVYEGIFDFVAQKRELTISYVRELHQTLTRHQPSVEAYDQFGNKHEVPLIRGDWKRQPNNPTRSDGKLHEYCPPEHVQAEMERLIKLHNEHIKKNIPPEIEASWLHHRFTQIHPFQDGNGRVARALASLIFLRAEMFPTIISGEIRDEYISALEKADEGDLTKLVEIFSKNQKNSFTKALSISHEVLQNTEQVGQVIHAAIERIKTKNKTERKEFEKVFDYSKKLEKIGIEKLREISSSLNRELSGTGYKVNVGHSTDIDQRFWFRKQVVEMAKQYDYYADTKTYSEWVRLKIQDEQNRRMDLVLSFHAVGYNFYGIMCTSAFAEFRGHGEGGETVIDGPHALISETFQFYYNSIFDFIKVKFESWLNDVVVSGLDLWRREI